MSTFNTGGQGWIEQKINRKCVLDEFHAIFTPLAKSRSIRLSECSYSWNGQCSRAMSLCMRFLRKHGHMIYMDQDQISLGFKILAGGLSASSSCFICFVFVLFFVVFREEVNEEEGVDKWAAHVWSRHGHWGSEMGRWSEVEMSPKENSIKI